MLIPVSCISRFSVLSRLIVLIWSCGIGERVEAGTVVSGGCRPIEIKRNEGQVTQIISLLCLLVLFARAETRYRSWTLKVVALGIANLRTIGEM